MIASAYSKVFRTQVPVVLLRLHSITYELIIELEDFSTPIADIPKSDTVYQEAKKGIAEHPITVQYR